MCTLASSLQYGFQWLLVFVVSFFFRGEGVGGMDEFIQLAVGLHVP